MKLDQEPKQVKPAKPLRLTITAAALALGVTRTHLSLVIHGHRQSRSLTARYAALKQAA
jgi:plasmid maintenance system antidote protein VapI